MMIGRIILAIKFDYLLASHISRNSCSSKTYLILPESSTGQVKRQRFSTNTFSTASYFLVFLVSIEQNFLIFLTTLVNINCERLSSELCKPTLSNLYNLQDTILVIGIWWIPHFQSSIIFKENFGQMRWNFTNEKVND